MFPKSTKVLVAALALAATSLMFVANASAGPGQPGWWRGGSNDTFVRDRHDPTNTNGF